MRDVCVRLPDWLFVEVTDFATKCGISRGAVLRQLALERFDCEESRDSLSPPVPSLAEPLAPVGPSLAEPLTPPPAAAPQVVQSRCTSLDTTADERAAYAAKRAEADRKRRVLLAAMGVSHPADAVLPATFFPGERDFAAAHPELAI